MAVHHAVTTDREERNANLRRVDEFHPSRDHDRQRQPEASSSSEGQDEKLGATIKMLWTQGQYDLVSILEAPDEATARAVTLAIASQGNVRTQTLRAFTLDEMTATVDKLE